MDVALTTPVAGGDPPKAGGPPGLVPGGAGGLRVISIAKPNRGLPGIRLTWPGSRYIFEAPGGPRAADRP